MSVILKILERLILIVALLAWAFVLHFCQYANRYHLSPERFRPSFWSLKGWR